MGVRWVYRSGRTQMGCGARGVAGSTPGPCTMCRMSPPHLSPPFLSVYTVLSRKNKGLKPKKQIFKKSKHYALSEFAGGVSTRTRDLSVAARQTHSLPRKRAYVWETTDVTPCMVMEVLSLLGQLITK